MKETPPRADSTRRGTRRFEAPACVGPRPLLYSTGLFHWPKEKRLTLTARSVVGRLAKLERRV